ncbi:chromosome partitioning protein ParB [Trinickia violacea]|uniref:Chromosome partitioning protein ParB n=1 Tax=Trinickia violacea TaxID=2571746 RepID=A0A4P8J0A8_9BURK|nr:chromosome partitioning protein ParB [Trinickia violacea]QCP55082.1 chromosome partitioning protein ParB [Trinickia violacea]
MAGFGKKLSERTSSIHADPTRASTTTREAPRTSPGRIFDAQNLVNQAEERREVAESELAFARKRIEELESGAAAAGAIDVEISTLVEVPGRRRILSAEEYAELRANLEGNPLAYPIVYLPLPDGRNEIIAGHNRVGIYRDDLKRAHIKGIPFKGTPLEAELAAVFSNLLAPSLPDYEKYRQFVRMQELSGLTQADIIRASGLSQGHVARIFSFSNLPDAAKELIAANPHRLGGNAAQKLATLSQNGGEERVVTAIGKLVTDEKMTQEMAVALATPKMQKPTATPQVTTISVGKKKLCDISVRNGVVGLRFTGKEGHTVAEEWSAKIAEFIRSNLATE